MSPIKFFLRKLIEYALTDKKSPSTIWLGWADVNFGGRKGINIGAPEVDTNIPRARAGDILSGRFIMARMPDGPAGYVLTAQGIGVDPAWAITIPPGVWEVLADVTLDVDSDYIDFTGLDINTDGCYVLIMIIKNPTTAAASYLFRVEAVAGDWSYQLLRAENTSVSATRGYVPLIGATAAGDRLSIIMHIVRDLDGYVRASVFTNWRTGDYVRLDLYAVCSTVTFATVSQIRIETTVTGALGAGSRFILARVKSP